MNNHSEISNDNIFLIINPLSNCQLASERLHVFMNRGVFLYCKINFDAQLTKLTQTLTNPPALN